MNEQINPLGLRTIFLNLQAASVADLHFALQICKASHGLAKIGGTLRASHDLGAGGPPRSFTFDANSAANIKKRIDQVEAEMVRRGLRKAKGGAR